MKKHKIFLYPLEENGKVRVFLFQSGDIGADRSLARRYGGPHNFSCQYGDIRSYDCGEISGTTIYVNGQMTDQDFKIFNTIKTKEEFDKLKELEYAYNNR